jgi:hypothetical protein
MASLQHAEPAQIFVAPLHLHFDHAAERAGREGVGHAVRGDGDAASIGVREEAVAVASVPMAPPPLIWTPPALTTLYWTNWISAYAGGIGMSALAPTHTSSPEAQSSSSIVGAKAGIQAARICRPSAEARRQVEHTKRAVSVRVPGREFSINRPVRSRSALSRSSQPLPWDVLTPLRRLPRSSRTQ